MDWEKLGLKIGLEVHQQLATKKLFCDCSTAMREEKLVTEFERKIYPVAGEVGKIDVAAAYEAMKSRTFVYHGYEGEECLVDSDEEPPHNLNEEALKIALGVAMVLKLKSPNILCVMRKNVSDGSACSAFQRTLIVGRESSRSFIETSSKNKVRIEELYLEEDSCKIEKAVDNKVYYSLSRQGIPLLELRTAPDIKSPEQAKEVAEKIGMILRSFSVRRGIGSIRQDINLSIGGKERIELKGFQNIKMMPKVIENEVKRQIELLKKGRRIKGEVRKVNPDNSTSFLRPLPGAARMYPETDLPLIKISSELIKKVEASLPKLREEVVEELRKKGLSEEYASIVVREGKLERFNELLKSKVSPVLIAKILVLFPKEIAAREKLPFEEVEKKLEKHEKEVLSHIKQGKITESNLKDVLAEIAKGKKIDEIIARFRPVSKAEIKEEIAKLLKFKPGLTFSAYMGLLMAKFKGKINPAELAKTLKEESA